MFVSAAARLVDKKTTIKVITAKFKNVDQGENAAKWLIDKGMKNADGDLKSFIQTWSGLPEGSEELNNYYNHLSYYLI